MRKLKFAAAILILTAGSAAAAPRTPCEMPWRFLESPQGAYEQSGQKGYWFCNHTTTIAYGPGDGDHLLLRMHGFRGVKLVGLPSFVREVSTADGRALWGKPKAGDYTIEMYLGGKYVPSLDMHLRFIPR